MLQFVCGFRMRDVCRTTTILLTIMMMFEIYIQAAAAAGGGHISRFITRNRSRCCSHYYSRHRHYAAFINTTVIISNRRRPSSSGFGFGFEKGLLFGRRKLLVSSDADIDTDAGDEQKEKQKQKIRQRNKTIRKSKTTNAASSSAKFWKFANDQVGICSMTGSISFKVRGNPLPLRRHRTSRGFTYNPSAAAQDVFRNVVIENLLLLPEYSLSCNTDNIDDDDSKPVLFPKENFIEMNLVFRMRRPRNHFRNSNPGENGGLDRLKATSPVLLCDSRVDIDNLAKFVLDACNGLLYHDDRQVIKLGITKTYDSENQCLGCTEVMIRLVTEDDLKVV